MPGGGDYLRPHVIHQAANAMLDFTILTGTNTLLKGKTNYTLRIQRIIVTISVSAAQSITFQDSASPTPLYVCKIPASPGADTRWDFDFGPAGKPLGDGLDLVMSMTAGNAGHVEVLAYYKPDAVMAVGNNN
jgi:hypothetical protein